MNHRMMPPSGGPATVVTKANGRTYTCAQGATVDAPDFDSAVLQANGWSVSADSGVGATAARPSGVGLKVGAEFHDTTLGYNIKWDGKVWRNPTSGASA
jgi:hypothetical protein